MRTITVETWIAAPPQRCFDLARSVDAHLKSAADTAEWVVKGRTSGLLELNEEITWEARHFGVTQRLSSRITKMDRPRYFQDRMVRGAFASFEHDHHFEAINGGTRMIDVLRFAAPLGWMGRVAERLILEPHLTRFLLGRGKALKVMAECRT